MLLNASDFYCVPDGRVLDGVSIAAGSKTLTASSGTLRATDVGKSISIPGAADLHTVVEALTNRPDRVRLADHARAQPTGAVVVLSAGPITDGELRFGSSVLRSATAHFSDSDVGMPVTFFGAGLHTTTIAEFTSDTSVVLTDAAPVEVIDGAADVWRFDSRPGFEQLLDAIAAADTEQTIVQFDAGVYDFSRPPNVGSAMKAALGLRGRNNLLLQGRGAGVTVLRLMPEQDLGGPDTHVIQAIDCHHLTIRDLTVHGAFLTMGRVNEQMHGVFLGEGCHDVAIEHVDVFQTAGDGIRLLGSNILRNGTINKVRRVWVDGCRIVQNRRTGISFQRASEFVWIRDCYIEMTPPSNDACIDFEPTGVVKNPADEPVPGEVLAPTDVVIDSNVLVHNTPAVAVSLSGVSATDPTRRVRFSGNTLMRGGIGGVHAEDVEVSGNRFVAGDTGQVMVFRGAFSGLRIERNAIEADVTPRDGIRLAITDGVAASGVRVIGNDITTGGIGIAMFDLGDDIEVRGNRVRGFGGAVGIRVALEKPHLGVHHELRIADNTVAGFGGAGIEVRSWNSAAQFAGLEITGNELVAGIEDVPNELVGIRLDGPDPEHGTDAWIDRALVAANRIAHTIGHPLERHVTVPFVAIGGNVGERAILEGDIEPEGRVPALFGSLYVHIGSEPTTALYLKATGDGPTGWTRVVTAGL